MLATTTSDALSTVTAEDGYAVIDALVALMILAATLVCAVSATVGSRDAASAALELRRANSLSIYLLETARGDPGVETGAVDGLTWRREIFAPVMTFHASGVCERSVVVTGTKSHRSYAAKASTVCQIAPSS